jgi:hypothetical protein
MIMRPRSEPAIITLLLIDAVAVLWTPTPCHLLVMETVPPAWPRSGSRMPCTVEDELVVTSSLWRMSSRLCMPYAMEDELEVAPSLWRMSLRSRTPCALGASSKLSTEQHGGAARRHHRLRWLQHPHLAGLCIHVLHS